MDEQQYAEIVRQVRPWTMAPDLAVRQTVMAAASVVEQGLDGVFIECGTWRGGCSMAMLLAQRIGFGRVVKPVYLLDSFEGLPTATDKDGPIATAYQRQEVLQEWYFDNCRAARSDVEQGMTALGFTAGEHYSIVPGWFDQTLPPLVEQLRTSNIALLRIDCDWYDPVLLCYEQLEPLVVDEGVILIDDYYAFDGCARATHEYLARHDLPYRIQSIPNFSGAYMVKRQARDLARWYH